MKKIEVLGLQTIPQIKEGDNLAEIIVKSAEEEINGINEKDIIVLTSKIVSKAQGLLLNLSDVKPSRKTMAISRKTGKNPQWLQMISEQGHEILAILPLKGVIESHIMNASGGDDQRSQDIIDHEQAICITKSPDGRIHTCDAGIDGSNHENGVLSMLPEDPDKTAMEIRKQIQELTGKKVAVILADTEMIPFGTIDLAVGSSGIEPMSKAFGKPDLFGKPKFGGMDLVAHELAAASALVFGQIDAGIPVAVIRGYQYKINEIENILNTILAPTKREDFTGIIKASMRATAHTKGFRHRVLLRIASWFI